MIVRQSKHSSQEKNVDSSSEKIIPVTNGIS